MCEITWGDFIALPPSKHQHCTDEAQKAETVLSAVSYIYIYIYIYIFTYFQKRAIENIYIRCIYLFFSHQKGVDRIN